ncbi:hypothetical protein OFM83_29490, partial [Escherichia coli]|nr:hypothetical protein [Escherichia coli]
CFWSDLSLVRVGSIRAPDIIFGANPLETLLPLRILRREWRISGGYFHEIFSFSEQLFFYPLILMGL